jgi:hypothetical protein
MSLRSLSTACSIGLAIAWPQVPPDPGPLKVPSATGKQARTNALTWTLAVEPRDPNVVSLGGAEGGVWKTTDGGANWAPLTDNQPCLSISSIAIDPGHPDTVYAATGEGVFSTDRPRFRWWSLWQRFQSGYCHDHVGEAGGSGDRGRIGLEIPILVLWSRLNWSVV